MVQPRLAVRQTSIGSQVCGLDGHSGGIWTFTAFQWININGTLSMNIQTGVLIETLLGEIRLMST